MATQQDIEIPHDSGELWRVGYEDWGVVDVQVVKEDWWIRGCQVTTLGLCELVMGRSAFALAQHSSGSANPLQLQLERTKNHDGIGHQTGQDGAQKARLRAC